MPDSQILAIIIILVVGIALFIALRTVVLWYYKIDRIVELMERQDKSLQQIAFFLSGKQVEKKADDK